MNIYEYHMEADNAPDSGMRIECRGDTKEETNEQAISLAADVVCKDKTSQYWTLSLVERWENPELDDCVDANGEFHFVEIAKFDKAIGIIRTEL